MYEEQDLVPGRILRRYQRFLADVELEDGRVVTAHCTNTGTMASCWETGDQVLLRWSHDPKRKLACTWVACFRSGTWVGVDTGVPNRSVARCARVGALPGLPGLREIRTEVRYGREGSRIDLVALDGDGRQVFVEIKNTTLRRGEGVLFPDAVTERGARHLRELRAMVEDGHRAAILFFIQRGDVAWFDAARDVDPGYALELDRAAGLGVEVLPLRVRLLPERQPDGLWSLVWGNAGLLPWQPSTRAE